MNAERFILSNGLEVILEENHNAPVISFNAVAKVGSAFESKQEAGIAHYIEHMIFKGTPSMPAGAMAAEIEAAGGDVNAYTSFDQTVYYINMAARFSDKGLAILADAVQNPLFDAEEIENERAVILEEISRGKDSPGNITADNLFRNAFKKHPYGRPIIGSPTTVKSFTQKDFLRFYKRWYSPHNMAFVVVGDFKTKSMLKKIERLFSTYKGKKPPARPSDKLCEPGQTSARFSLQSMSTQSNYFCCGYHVPDINHADVPAVDVMAHVLGCGDSSRLEQALKQKQQLAHRIYAYAYTPHDPGLVIIDGTSADKQTAKLFEGVQTEIAKMQNELITTSELANAKLNIHSSSIYEQETVGGHAGKLAYYLSTAGTHNFEEKYYQALREVGTADVQRVAQKYLLASNCTSSITVAENSKWKKNPTPLKKSLQATKTKKPTKKKTSSNNPTVIKLKNGLKIIVHENPHLPLVAITAATEGGLRFETSSNNGINHLMARTVSLGTSTKTALEIAHQCDEIAGSVDGFAGRNTIGLRAEFLSDYLREGFSLFADILCNPAFDKKEVQKEKNLQLQALKDQEDALARLAFINFLKELFPQHPYGLRALGSKTSVGKLNSAILASSWKQQMIGGNLTISIVGKVNTAEIKKLAEEFLSQLPKGKSKRLKIKTDPKPKAIKFIETKKPDRKQAHIVLGSRGPSLIDKDYHAYVVMNNILSGQGGRLFLELRDKMGLAYSVSSILQPGFDPGHFAVYIGTDPTKIDTAVNAMKIELEKISTKLVSKAELNRAKQYLVGTYELELQRNSSLSSNYTFNELYGFGLEEMQAYPKKILKITREDVLKAAKNVYNPNAYVLSIVRPA